MTTQKWTTFYMKVLTRIATLPGIEIRVEFKSEVEDEMVIFFFDEIRNGLREVGVTEDVRLLDSVGSTSPSARPSP